MCRRVVLLLVAGLTVAACGPSTNLESRPAATTAPTQVASQSVTPKSTPTPTQPAGPKGFALGETGTLSLATGDAAEITVANARRTNKAPSRYAKPPANGVFLTVDVIVKAIGSDVFSVNPFDLYARGPDGTQYEYGGGNSTYMLSQGALNMTTLNPGEQVKGPLTFDVPAGTIEVVYAPRFRALGYWRVP